MVDVEGAKLDAHAPQLAVETVVGVVEDGVDVVCGQARDELGDAGVLEAGQQVLVGRLVSLQQRRHSIQLGVQVP